MLLIYIHVLRSASFMYYVRNHIFESIHSLHKIYQNKYPVQDELSLTTVPWFPAGTSHRGNWSTIVTVKFKCFQSTTSSTFLPYFFISRCFFAFSDLSIACCLLSNFALTWYEKGSWWKELSLHCANMTTKTIITQSTNHYLTQNIYSQRIIIQQ